MQRFVDSVLAVAKESVKTFTYESLHNIVRLINGVSALLLAILPGKGNMLEGLNGWELRPTFRGPRFPRWMENGVSSFNKFVHELSVDSDLSSEGYSSAEEDYDSCPPSPMSQSSRFSRSSTFNRSAGARSGWIAFFFSWIFFPVRFLLGIPLCLCRLFSSRRSTSTRRNHKPSQQVYPIKRSHSNPKDHVIHRATDRRRGVIEDLHLGIEICIEAVFDFFHRTSLVLLSPSEVLKLVYGWFSSKSIDEKDAHNGISDAPVPTATLGESDPTLTERPTTSHPLNTDARTCQDVITELGYPYEAIRVTTSDGYVLLLERIPRRDSRKAVYLQHGVFDSSMGWVSNGVVGSPAFAAYDQGFDVYLGNLRGLVSREHVDKKISSRKYWRYSINEHGLEDIPAMIEKIHQVKTSELKIYHPEGEEETRVDQPYKLCAISHSLGGAAMLMYVITRRIEELPHRLSRLILLSPAGFHHESNLVFTAVEYLCLLLAPVLAPIMPGLYIPTRFFRMLLNKLARDFHNYPAVGGLVQTLIGYFLGGDSSDWVGVLGLPHYNMNDMPGVSFYVVHHLAQMKHAKRFIMYDYGSASANMAVYGSKEPLDLGEYYGLIDIPVDLVAGRKDNVIKPAMVKEHYRRMKEAGVEATFNEYEYAHLDFTFSHREELMAFVMSRLLLVDSTEKQRPNLKASRSKRKGK